MSSVVGNRKGRSRPGKKAGAAVTGRPGKDAFQAKPVDRSKVELDAVTKGVMKRIAKTREILAR